MININITKMKTVKNKKLTKKRPRYRKLTKKKKLLRKPNKRTRILKGGGRKMRVISAAFKGVKNKVKTGVGNLKQRAKKKLQKRKTEKKNNKERKKKEKEELKKLKSERSEKDKKSKKDAKEKKKSDKMEKKKLDASGETARIKKEAKDKKKGDLKSETDKRKAERKAEKDKLMADMEAKRGRLSKLQPNWMKKRTAKKERNRQEQAIKNKDLGIDGTKGKSSSLLGKMAKGTAKGLGKTTSGILKGTAKGVKGALSLKTPDSLKKNKEQEMSNLDNQMAMQQGSIDNYEKKKKSGLPISKKEEEDYQKAKVKKTEIQNKISKLDKEIKILKEKEEFINFDEKFMNEYQVIDDKLNRALNKFDEIYKGITFYCYQNKKVCSFDTKVKNVKKLQQYLIFLEANKKIKKKGASTTKLETEV